MSKRITFDAIDNHHYLNTLHSFGVDFRAREIYLSGEPDRAEMGDSDEPGVEFYMASKFIRNIRVLALESKKPILIHMKTCGGLWEEGMAIYDAIKHCPCPVTILNYTHARSMSSLIFLAADWRVMMPNSYFMFHHGEYAAYGEWKTVESGVDWTKRIVEPTMYDIYVEALLGSKKWYAKSRDYCMKWLKAQMAHKGDVFLTAEEAVENGFADEVFDGDWDSLTSWK